LLGSERKGLETGLRLGIRIANLKLSILAPVKFRSLIWTYHCAFQYYCTLVMTIYNLIVTGTKLQTNIFQ